MQEPGSPSATQALTFLRGLVLAASAYRLYPNPKGQPAFKRARELLTDLQLPAGGLRIEVGPGRFRLGPENLDLPDDSLERLAHALFERGVDWLQLRSRPTEDELLAVAQMLTLDPESLDSQGGPRQFLIGKGTLSLEVAPRELLVETEPEDNGWAEGLPESLRRLISDSAALARALEAEHEPEGALEQLKALFEEAARFGIEEHQVLSRIADTAAEMSPSYRALILGRALQSMQDRLSAGLVGQFSDTELADSLNRLAGDAGVERVIKYTMDLLEASEGRRDELPTVVAQRLLHSGFDEQTVYRALAHAGVDSSFLPTETLGPAELRDQQELQGLREEALAEEPQDSIQAGIPLLTDLLQNPELSDYDHLVRFVEESVERSVTEEQLDRAVSLLSAVTEVAEKTRDPTKRARLNEAVNNSTTSQLIALVMSRLDSGDQELPRRALETLQERMIPALLARLADETDAPRRHRLVDMLGEVAHSNIDPLLEALSDERWYVVRNVISILGKAGIAESVPGLSRAAKHPDPRVRREAIRALASAGGSQSIGPLAQALKDPEHAVRSAALATLGALPHPDSTRALISFLKHRPGRAESKEALTSLASQPNDEADRFLGVTARRWWPPTSRTRELARHARSLLAGGSP